MKPRHHFLQPRHRRRVPPELGLSLAKEAMGSKGGHGPRLFERNEEILVSWRGRSVERR